MTNDEEFFAWLDGELPADRAAAIEARVAANAGLRALAERHRALRSDLRDAFDEVATPAPDRIDGPSAAPPLPKPANENRRWPLWTSLAATLAFGLAVGTLLPGRGTPDSPVRVQGGTMIAAAGLDRALDTQLASAGANEAVRIGLTFRNADGHWCRSFTGAAVSGLACRAGDDWRVEALYPSQASGGDYRMAAGVDPRLASAIDRELAGEAADAASERAARDNGWR